MTKEEVENFIKLEEDIHTKVREVLNILRPLYETFPYSKNDFPKEHDYPTESISTDYFCLEWEDRYGDGVRILLPTEYLYTGLDKIYFLEKERLDLIERQKEEALEKRKKLLEEERLKNIKANEEAAFSKFLIQMDKYKHEGKI